MKKLLTIILILVTFQLTSFSQDNKPKATCQVAKAKVTFWCMSFVGIEFNF